MTHFNPTRLLSVANVIERRGGSRSSFLDATNPRSERYNPDIPKPIKLGRRTFYVEEEIEAWLKRTIEECRAHADSGKSGSHAISLKVAVDPRAQHAFATDLKPLNHTTSKRKNPRPS